MTCSLNVVFNNTVNSLDYIVSVTDEWMGMEHWRSDTHRES